MSQLSLTQVKQSYEIIESLLNEGTFPGAYAPAIQASLRHVRAMIQNIQEQIDGLKVVPSDRTKEDAAGMGTSGNADSERSSDQQEGNGT